MTPEELIENFELLGNWEERYGYLIDLGRQLEAFPEDQRNDETRVRGCMSQVWLTSRVEPGPPRRLFFVGDSDAHIVKGLIALLLTLCSGRTPQEILALDLAEIFRKLGLDNHITVNRRNGFFAMVERIHQLAEREQNA